ncbi:8-oxo-dGTP diphosphatase MutT [Saccharobesus litoralis]|uniref:8-oxo-dGTP diphosphatase n=1 Tax=Saccharobesus litoralis TaxID=2172099 RepID=A0A2S0VWY6_9ALTE|nr:8-oxo-dGTP diphosphatase MutT [Saccharobesus litoralis]AWB68731.1 8-oxo-dGTP diphosphatase MutT [Saccharobesus litoralis]
MKIVNVAVGVVVNEQKQILLAKRAKEQHQGGLWEFPGGKVELGESTFKALVREFKEEVDLELEHGQPLILIEHDYGDKQVRLDTWLVEQFSGSARGVEGQEVRWVPVAELANYEFPAANQAILQAINQTLG